MTCDELRPDYDLYALGIAGPDESHEIQNHLAERCPNCTPGIQQAFAFTSQLAALTRLVDPPARLRARVLASVKPELITSRNRAAFGWSILFGASSLILFAIVVLLGYQTQHLSALRRTETSQLQRAMALLTAPDSQVVNFGNTPNQPPRGRVVVNRQGVVLIAANLPRLQEGKTFELWLIPKGAKPIPSGLFKAQPNGTALTMQSGPVPDNLSVVAVSVENEGGAPQPTTTPIIAAETK